MIIHPPPRMLAVMAVHPAVNRVGKIEVVAEEFCGFGIVQENASKILEHIKPGMVVSFPASNFNAVRMDEEGLWGTVFEEAITGYYEQKELPFTFQKAHVSKPPQVHPAKGITFNENGARIPIQ